MSEIKYEKVTGSIFDLKSEFEAEELYCSTNNSSEYKVVVYEFELLAAKTSKTLYRKVKPKKTYKGVELPEWANWVATDKNGYVVAYEHKPFLSVISGSWVVKSGVLTRVGVDDEHTNWKGSLIKL